jgi:hypothetical protein
MARCTDCMLETFSAVTDVLRLPCEAVYSEISSTSKLKGKSHLLYITQLCSQNPLDRIRPRLSTKAVWLSPETTNLTIL